MPESIWKKIIDEVGSAGEYNEIMPYYYGEPLMNPRLFEVCDYISEHAPNAKISISTNCSLLTPENTEKLLNIKTLYFLNFSLYAGTKETYESVMGLKYENLDKVAYAVDQFRKRKPNVILCIGATDDGRFVTQPDCDELIRRFGGDIVSFHPISFNNQHGVHTRTGENREPCPVPFTNAVVYCDGKVGICCFDVECELYVGDVTKTSMLEAVNSNLAKKYRFAHANGCKDIIPLCRSCTQPI
jgi:hypothetical protein